MTPNIATYFNLLAHTGRTRKPRYFYTLIRKRTKIKQNRKFHLSIFFLYKTQLNVREIHKANVSGLNFTPTGNSSSRAVSESLRIENKTKNISATTGAKQNLKKEGKKKKTDNVKLKKARPVRRLQSVFTASTVRLRQSPLYRPTSAK